MMRKKSSLSGCSAVLMISLIWLVMGVSQVALADGGVYRDRADINVPNRGLSMAQVEAKFGSALAREPSVGDPPITRWEYNGFVVYFEYEHVIHSVITS